jgi:anti-sigma B factor antagonist
MKHRITEDKDALIVAFEGDVDLASSPEARKILLSCVDKGQPVLVDLSGVTYIDSSGIASLVESFQKVRKKGGTFFLVSVSEAALRVLSLARLDKVFTIHPSVEDGLASLG